PFDASRTVPSVGRFALRRPRVMTESSRLRNLRDLRFNGPKMHMAVSGWWPQSFDGCGIDTRPLMLIGRSGRAIGPCLLLDGDRRLAPAPVRCGADELDQCSHRINPPRNPYRC